MRRSIRLECRRKTSVRRGHYEVGHLPNGGHALIKGDRGGLRHGVRRHAVDAWPMVEDRLDYRLLGRSQESADVKDHCYQADIAGRRGHAERVVPANTSGLRSKALAQPGLQK